MREKVLAAVGILGGLVVLALGGVAIYEANAQTVPAVFEHPNDEITGPQAACFSSWAQSIWAQVTPANVVQLEARRDKYQQENKQIITTVIAEVVELVTTHEDVFTALDVVGGVIEIPGCEKSQDGENMTYCIRRGPVALDATQKAGLKTCATAIVSPIQDIRTLTLTAGPPRTFTVTRIADLSSHEYATCRAGGTCKRAK